MAKKNNLALYILIAMILGILAGLGLKFLPAGLFRDTILINGIITVVGSGFINVLKMLVVPLVFVSVICGMTSLQGVRQVGRIGVKVFVLYCFTTAIAICVALGTSLLFKVGQGLDMTQTLTTDIVPPVPASFAQTILDIIPTNIFTAFSAANMLQILFLAIFMGTIMTIIGSKGTVLIDFFDSLNALFTKMVIAVMKIAPFGVFCLMTKAIFNVGAAALLPLVKYFLVFLLVIAIQGFIVYALLLKFVGRVPITPFLKKYAEIIPIAFSTSSSNATLPATMAGSARMGVSQKIYAFSLPLGATINMDGTAIVQAVSVVFLASVYQLDLTLPVLLTVLLTTLIISIGSPAVPGGSHVTLAVILQSIGIPIEGIALIMGFERLCGMTLTVLNVMGDSMCAVLVARSEKELDVEKYKDMSVPMILDVDQPTEA